MPTNVDILCLPHLAYLQQSKQKFTKCLLCNPLLVSPVESRRKKYWKNTVKDNSKAPTFSLNITKNNVRGGSIK